MERWADAGAHDRDHLTCRIRRALRTVVGLTERGEAEMSKIVELANRYEVPMAEPEWFADVIERYQLSMPTP